MILGKNRSNYLAQRTLNAPNIALLTETEITRVDDTDHFEIVEMTNRKTNRTSDGRVYIYRRDSAQRAVAEGDQNGRKMFCQNRHTPL